MAKTQERFKAGDIVTVDSPINAYNDKGSAYRLEAGLTALILDTNQHDLTIYTCGEVLYCPTDVYLRNTT